MQPVHITLNKEDFDSIASTSLIDITEQKPVKIVMVHAIKAWVVFNGSVSSPGGTRTISFRPVVPLNHYNGDLSPLPYNEHFQAVDRGERARSYEGMKISAKGIFWVITGPKYEACEADLIYTTQLSLFE